MKKIKVLVVDDSAVVRQVVASMLAEDPEIEVMAAVADPILAMTRMRVQWPDVIVLDIEMPRMDGITFLKVLMKHRPMPVIIMSSLTQAGSHLALEALQAGAVDVMEKPGGASTAHSDGSRLAEKIRAAASARIRAHTAEPETPARVDAIRTISPARALSERKVILLGASTGGTEALKTVLTSARGDLPGICIVQHIPAYFSKAFADRLNRICPMEVREAKSADVVQQGLALVAPGGYHMLLKWRGTHYTVELNEGPPVHHQRPAVDILFDSALKAGAGPHAVAALLTGMGSDGAAGLRRLREAGAMTIAQNEETCVVFGMPREAIRMEAARHILPLEQIGPRLDYWTSNTTSHSEHDVRHQQV